GTTSANPRDAAGSSAGHGTGGMTTTGCGLGGEAGSVFLGLCGGNSPQWKDSGHATAPTEDEILGILGALTNFGRIGTGEGGLGGAAGAAAVQGQMQAMTERSPELLRQVLDRMNQEIENLRNILGAHEDKMTEAGVLTESHREILDRQFWAAVPDSGKRAVLLSDEACCIPPRNVQSYVSELIKNGNTA